MSEFIPKLVPEKILREKILGISITTFWRLKRRGKLPRSCVIGGRNFYEHSEIVAWLENVKSD